MPSVVEKPLVGMPFSDRATFNPSKIRPMPIAPVPWGRKLEQLGDPPPDEERAPRNRFEIAIQCSCVFHFVSFEWLIQIRLIDLTHGQ